MFKVDVVCIGVCVGKEGRKEGTPLRVKIVLRLMRYPGYLCWTEIVGDSGQGWTAKDALCVAK
jgi:hypothetical protein